MFILLRKYTIGRKRCPVVICDERAGAGFAEAPRHSRGSNHHRPPLRRCQRGRTPAGEARGDSVGCIVARCWAKFHHHHAVVCVVNDGPQPFTQKQEFSFRQLTAKDGKLNRVADTQARSVDFAKSFGVGNVVHKQIDMSHDKTILKVNGCKSLGRIRFLQAAPAQSIALEPE